VSYILDTNVLLRWERTQLLEHPLAVAAVDVLLQRGEPISITPQNLVEFWSVSTRPIDQNGFGLSPAQVDSILTRLEAVFDLLPDLPAIHDEWRQVILSVGVRGRQVHDARLVAVMKAHGITHLLTFNDADFRRYPGITVVHPQDMIAAP
jgi:predicted nucleic acid-binding protein